MTVEFLENEIKYQRSFIREYEEILEEDVPLSIYGYKSEAQLKGKIKACNQAIKELKEKIKEVSNA